MQNKKHRRLFLETLESRIVLTAPAVTIDGLVSWYRAEGDADDFAGGNDGHLIGGTEPGQVGDAFHSNYATVATIDDSDSLRLQVFTIDAWVYAYSGGQIANSLGGEIIAKDIADGPQRVSLGIFGPGNGGRFTFAASVGGDSTQSFQSVAVTQGQWHHVAMTSDGAYIHGYVDGVLQLGPGAVPAAIPLSSPITYNTVTPWTIGGHAGLVSSEFAGHFYDGLIDEVGIYQRALSQLELQTIVAHGSNGRYTVPSGQQFTLPGAFSDADPETWTAKVDYDYFEGTMAAPADLNLNPNHTFSLAHVYSAVGPHIIRVWITDATDNTTAHSLVVNVTPPPPNTAPVANNDNTWSVNEDETLTVPASGVLANDVDAEGNPMTAVLVAGPVYGSLALNANGSFTYTPAANYNGPDSFTYKANDGTADSNTATVHITVTAVNDPPVAQNDTLNTNEDTQATGTLVATDVDSANLAYSVADASNAHGIVNITNPATGAYSYSPDANYNGPASFTFRANDGTLNSNTTVISITVAPINDAPVAQAGTLTTDEDTSGMGTLVATDVDSANLAYSVADSSDAHGIVNITNPATGAYTYNPDANYYGPAGFTFKANDGAADCNIANVTITVVQSAVNHLPTVSTLGLDHTNINEHGTVLLTGTVSDADAGDIHSVTINWGDGSALEMAAATGPTHAFSATHLYVDDNPTSTPIDNYQISVTATDNHGGVSLPVGVMVTVNNVAPVVNPINGPASGVPGLALAFTGSFTDVGTADTQTLAWQAINSSSVVVATGSGPGFTFTPSAVGSYTVQLIVTDDDGGTGTVTQAVNVTPAKMLGTTTLLVGGTIGNDTFTLTPTANPGEYRVTLNGLILGAYSPTASVQIYGDGGVDTIVLNGNSASNAFEVRSDSLVLNGLSFFDHAVATRQINALGSSDTITVFGGSATIDGGAATDTLVATGVGSHDWQITAQNTGSLDGLVFFSSVEQLVGGAGADTFHLGDNGRITGSIDGGSGSDLLIAPNSANTWKIDVANGGTVKNTNFIGLESLQGGSDADKFRMLPGGSFAGTIDGGSGTDLLDYSAYTTAVVVNLGAWNATAIGGLVSGFEDIAGGDGNDLLAGNAAANDISGGNGDDIILGLAGNDTLDGNAGMDIVAGGSGADTVHGNNGDDILVGGVLTYADESSFAINQAALNAIMAEWTRNLAYSMRIGHLTVNSSGGFNGGFMLNSSTVQDDFAVDTLFGDAGQDWFLAEINDIVKTTKGETVTDP
jgi:VCBS repeat-containing protein